MFQERVSQLALEERLILEVSNQKILYDQSLPEFKDTEVKNNAWASITRRLMDRDDLETIDKVKQRWKSLRDTYVKTIKKRNVIKNRFPFSKGKPYRYGKLMEFLDPYVRIRRISSNVPSSSSYDEAVDFQDSPPSEEAVSVQLDSVDDKEYSQVGETEPSTSQVSPVSADPTTTMTRRRRKKENYYCSSMDSAMKLVKKSHQQLPTNRNDVDDFFHGLAQTVKKLHPMTIARVKKHVANVVMDAEIEDLQSYYEVHQYMSTSPCSPPENSAQSLVCESSSSPSFHEEH